MSQRADAVDAAGCVASPAEQITQQFYSWERRGRGWQVWPYPVELEPPYRPFFHFLTAHDAPCEDDGRQPTFLSLASERLRLLLTRRLPLRSAAEAVPVSVPFEIPEPEAEPFAPTSDLVEVQLAIPPDLVISGEASEQLFLALSYASSPIAFEIVGKHDSTVVQLACRAEDLPQLRNQLRAHFPDTVVTETAGSLESVWSGQTVRDKVVVDLGLSHEFMRPLRTFRKFDADPLVGIVGALHDLGDGEVGVVQVLFQAARYPWTESIVRAVTDWDGEAFFEDAPDMVRLANEKVSRPLFAAVIRIAAQSPVRGRSWKIAQALGGALVPFSSPESNELIPLANDGYDEFAHSYDLVSRRSRRSGMILNSEELVSLVHLPSVSVRSEKLKRQDRNTKAAPAIATTGTLVLGENAHAGRVTTVSLTPDQRVRHTYVIGASGTGKSTLLLNMILQDIRNGAGIGVLDPHGDLIDQILEQVPEERCDDVILVDPSDEEYAVGFNILHAHSAVESNLLSSDLVGIFRRLSTSWGDQMTSVLGNAVLAFLESDRGGTIADLRRFLVEAEFRRAFLPTVRDAEVVYYWEKEFPLLTGRPQAPILTRLDAFLRPKLVRHMVSQKENRLDFAKMMDGGKIFLAKLSQGAIGEENAYLLGSFFVSKFHQVTMSRQAVTEAERRSYYLYVDEFHNFVTPSMASLLAGARKYRLGLVLAHQDLRQLVSRNEEVASAAISNPYTRICFRVGDQDAKRLVEGFSHFDAKDLQNLGTGEAVCRMERAQYDFNLKTQPVAPVEPALAMERRARIVALSREKYGTRREELDVEPRRAEPVTLPAQNEPTIVQPAADVAATDPALSAPPATASAPAPGLTPTRGQRPKAGEPPLVPSAPKGRIAGRGGQQHKYLQELIRRWAESRGWKVSVEKQILDGLGSVDVALEKGDTTVACEISITTSADHELGNIQKCLAAGYGQVLAVGLERKLLAKIERAAEDLGEDVLARLRFLTPEELFGHLEALDAEAAGKVETIRGYKVKVKYRATETGEQKAKKQAISQVIVGAMKRLGRKG